MSYPSDLAYHLCIGGPFDGQLWATTDEQQPYFYAPVLASLSPLSSLPVGPIPSLQYRRWSVLVSAEEVRTVLWVAENIPDNEVMFVLLQSYAAAAESRARFEPGLCGDAPQEVANSNLACSEGVVPVGQEASQPRDPPDEPGPPDESGYADMDLDGMSMEDIDAWFSKEKQWLQEQ